MTFLIFITVASVAFIFVHLFFDAPSRRDR
jgi:hypothetical protein